MRSDGLVQERRPAQVRESCALVEMEGGKPPWVR
jgi:hypothetical protein